WHHGYPQPDEDNLGYLGATYDLTGWCDQCGIGKKQKGPFQMNAEPKWGLHGILRLIWVYDEIFVTPHAWADVFRRHDIDRRPVLRTSGRELETVVQLAVEDDVGIATDRLHVERCPKCQRVKYSPITRGPFPKLTDTPSRLAVKTREYF